MRKPPASTHHCSRQPLRPITRGPHGADTPCPLTSSHPAKYCTPSPAGRCSSSCDCCEGVPAAIGERSRAISDCTACRAMSSTSVVSSAACCVSSAASRWRCSSSIWLWCRRPCVAAARASVDALRPRTISASWMPKARIACNAGLGLMVCSLSLRSHSIRTRCTRKQTRLPYICSRRLAPRR